MLDADILEAIVNMCKDRILTRLGYQAGYLATRKKSSLASVLDQAARAVQAHYGKTRQADVAPFLHQTTNLVTLLQSWNGSSTDPTTILRHLQPILLAISHFTKTTNLATLLSPLPPSTLDPGIKQSLPLRLLKLAKYRTTSLYLVRSAQTLPLFLHVQVLPISLPPPYFFRDQTVPPKTSSLPARLSLCQTPTPASSLCQKLSIPPATANAQFLTNVTSALKEARIHAEVQLVAHYDLYPTPFRPRVIASSKDACYLCNLFVSTHGGFHVPRTHGKLYKGWRLPVGVPGWEGVQERMNTALEARIKKAVGERMAMKGKWAVAFPNESMAWTVEGSMETLRGLGMERVLADVVSPRKESSPEPRQEDGEGTGEQQHLLLPEPSADKDDPSGDPAGEPKPMSDISTERINSGAETLSPTASVPVVNRSSPVSTTSQEVSPRTLSRKSPPPTSPPRAQPPGNGAPATNPQSLTPSSNHPLQLDIPGDPTPSRRTPTPPPSPKEQDPPKYNDTIMPPPHPPLYISPLPSSLTTTTTTSTTTSIPEPSHSSLPPPAPSSPEITNPKTIFLPLSQSKTTIHRLHPPPTRPANYIYTTGSIEIYPSYTASPHGSDAYSYSPAPEPSNNHNTNASPLSSPAPPKGVVEMRIRWLPPAVATRVLRGRHGTKITYLDRLRIGGDDVDGGDPDRGYLVKGKDVVLVEVVRG